MRLPSGLTTGDVTARISCMSTQVMGRFCCADDVDDAIDSKPATMPEMKEFQRIMGSDSPGWRERQENAGGRFIQVVRRRTNGPLDRFQDPVFATFTSRCFGIECTSFQVGRGLR